MIAILSDIHGNLPALNAVLDEAKRLGCRRIISLGDITGYYAQPAECIELLVQSNAHQLLGNHDHYLAAGLACPRSKTVSELINYQRKVVSRSQLEFLRSLSPIHEEASCSFVHGGWRDNLDEYLYTVSLDKLPSKARFCFSGHTHVQCRYSFGDKMYCNPGSVGQPRDGDSRSAFAILNEDDISLHRVEYDIQQTVDMMRNAGFDDPRLWEGLFIGAQIGGRVDTVTFE